MANIVRLSQPRCFQKPCNSICKFDPSVFVEPLLRGSPALRRQERLTSADVEWPLLVSSSTAKLCIKECSQSLFYLRISEILFRGPFLLSDYFLLLLFWKLKALTLLQVIVFLLKLLFGRKIALEKYNLKLWGGFLKNLL
jgi:hypothetical protein